MEDSFKKLLIFILTNCDLNIQWFDTHSDMDEECMETIYEDDNFKLIHCYSEDYYEIFGLSDSQAELLHEILNYEEL